MFFAVRKQSELHFVLLLAEFAFLFFVLGS
jgi:hypothetical protein